MYGDTKIGADGIKSVSVKVRYDYPSTPQPTVEISSSTAVKIKWTNLPPLNQFQKPVTSYIIVCQSSALSKKITVSAPALSHTITGLEIYTSYNITIKAVSIVGDGKWSQPLEFITESDIPTGFPTSITAEATTSQSIRVTWQAPTSGINGPLREYKVFCISGSDRRESTKAPQQPRTHTFTGLRKWTVYNVTVVIRNEKGYGPEVYVTSRTMEDAPGAVRNFQVTVLNSTSVGMNWTLPSETSGVIRGFNLSYSKTGSVSLKILPANKLSYVLSGLHKCTLYSFKILAHTIKDGPYTTEMQETTAEDAPSVPSGFKAEHVKPGGYSVPRVKLTWKKPDVCGDNVDHYNVSFSHNEDSTLKTEIVDKSKLSLTIPVWGGVTYTFFVRGFTNKDGPDAKAGITIPVYVPSISPSNLSFSDVNKTTFNFSWSNIPRSQSNGPVIAYEVNQTLVRRSQKARRSIEAVGQVKLMNSSCCSLYLHDLLVCAEYHIIIKGYTSAGAGPSNIKSLETSAPGPPVSLKVEDEKKREILLTWQKPISVTEEIKIYAIVFEGKKDYNSSFVHSGSLSASTSKEWSKKLYPDTRYTFQVSASTTCGKGKNSEPAYGTTRIDAPPAPVVGFVGNITADVNNITVWESSDINGQIKAYQIIVVNVEESSSFDDTKLKSYKEAEKEKLNYYITAEIETESDNKWPRVFTLGDEKDYNGYENAKMKKGKTYQVLQRALTQKAKKEYLAGPNTLIARGKIPAITESHSGKDTLGTSTAKTCIEWSVFAVSVAFNVVFLVFIVLLVVYIKRLRKQLEETKKADKSIPTKASTQIVYENTTENGQEEILPMTPLPAQTGSTYEQIDLHGAVDPSDVQTEVTGPNTTSTDKSAGYYESINEPNRTKPKPRPKPKPKQQIYETVQPETHATNPKQLQNNTASSLQSTYQSLMPENLTKPVYESLHTSSPQSTYQSLMPEKRTKPVYESLHTYGNTKINMGQTQECDI